MTKRSRLFTVLHLCSFLVFLYSLTLPIPALVGYLYNEHEFMSFIDSFVLGCSTGLIGLWLTRHTEKVIRPKDGFVVVVLFWLIFSALSTLPFYLDARLHLTLTDSLFEGVSGITTTGASILSNIDSVPKSVLYFRAQLNFLGGLGIIVLALAVMPFLGIGGSKIYQAEMPGPLKDDRFTPRLADTAKYLWIVYSTLALFCMLAYRIAGMDWFDALCHSLSTVSLGGFSTHEASLGYYHSAAVELVAGVFSILAAINFALYFIAFYSRSLKAIYTNPEFRFFITVLGLVVVYTCFELVNSHTFSGPDAIVHGFFQTVSIMTDNGLTTADYPNWPTHLVLLLLGASFFGGCVGSTCGGIKAMRFFLLYQQSKREMKQHIHPSATFLTKVGNIRVPDRVIQSIWGLFFLWIFLACIFTWTLVASGHDLVTAFGTVAACMNNMGVGYGATSTGFESLNEYSKLAMTLAMIMGRLEIFPILIMFSRTFWRF